MFKELDRLLTSKSDKVKHTKKGTLGVLHEVKIKKNWSQEYTFSVGCKAIKKNGGESRNNWGEVLVVLSDIEKAENA